jgi:hypothetical protein
VSTIAVRAEESTAVQRIVPTAPRVVCSIFGCPDCNWPLVGAKFTSCTADDIHEAVFEVVCDKCHWHGALLGEQWRAYESISRKPPPVDAFQQHRQLCSCQRH